MSARAAAPLALHPDPSAPLRAEGLRHRLAVAGVLAGIVMVVLDAAVANVALPAIARALAVDPARSVRVVTAYQLALVMALLPCAALGERLGPRRVYTVGVALFVGASALCASATSLPLLVAARFAQGLGGAAVLSLGVALLRRVVPPARMGAVIGWNALAVAVASAAGPSLGALALSLAPWRWLFTLSLPLGGLVLLATRAHPAAPGSARALDLGSATLSASVAALFVIGAEQLVTRPWRAASLLFLAALGVVALLRRARRSEAPLIPVDLLRDDAFRASALASVLLFVGQSAAMLSLPFYLRHALGQSALRTGLVITPWPVAVALVAPLAGRLADRVPAARLCALGGGVLALGLSATALAPRSGQPQALVPLLAVCGVGFGLFQVPNNRSLLLSAPPARSGAAGGLQATSRLVGQTIGSVGVSLLLTLTPIELAPRLGLGGAALFALAAGIVSARRSASASGPGLQPPGALGAQGDATLQGGVEHPEDARAIRREAPAQGEVVRRVVGAKHRVGGGGQVHEGAQLMQQRGHLGEHEATSAHQRRQRRLGDHGERER